jgi:hypothetical protein
MSWHRSIIKKSSSKMPPNTHAAYTPSTYPRDLNTNRYFLPHIPIVTYIASDATKIELIFETSRF